MSDQFEKSPEEWRKQLTPEQYRVARGKGTEKPFTGAYWNSTQQGSYDCVCCGATLFESAAKFDAGCGWPSFYAPLKDAPVEEQEDLSHGMRRVEARCKRCGAHLGHIFDDGPQPTGLRYCINSASLKFAKK